MPHQQDGVGGPGANRKTSAASSSAKANWRKVFAARKFLSLELVQARAVGEICRRARSPS